MFLFTEMPNTKLKGNPNDRKNPQFSSAIKKALAKLGRLIRDHKAKKLKPILSKAQAPVKINPIVMKNQDLEKLPDQIFWMKRKKQNEDKKL